MNTTETTTTTDLEYHRQTIRDQAELESAAPGGGSGVLATLVEGAGPNDEHDALEGVLDALEEDLDLVLELTFSRDVNEGHSVDLCTMGRFLAGLRRRIRMAHELRQIELNAKSAAEILKLKAAAS